MEQIKYGEHEDQHIDIYHNEDQEKPNTWLILIHGGYWRQKFSKSMLDTFLNALLHEGYSVVNVEYRRGTFEWPAPIEDVTSAIQAFKDSDFYHDETLISIGHSVGGQLALLASNEVDRTIALAPVTDVPYTKEHDLGDGAAEAYFKDAGDDVLKEASPIHQTPVQSETLIIHGFDDEKVHMATTLTYASKNLKDQNNITLYGYKLLPHLECINPESFHMKDMLDWIQH
ncbi:alpha/beta hydrolase [Staphylococcus massiliensis]|uniref:alpha/beta hydrolase n=1 Tax=Staphylococcus massiliensis TaxID=555791 RepID=UPI001EDDA06B|nr:alpha/beta hydrolase [Staphylococcus massiliensis]MCG3401675.1 alpha/beta hydrolase [Staphylococcus massiliensis]